MMKPIIYCFLLSILMSCTQHDKNVSNTPTYTHLVEKLSKSSLDSFLVKHRIDSSFKYAPEKRGYRKYNYSISGSDDNGNSVYGDIDFRGRFGSGYVEDENGNEISIDVEWTGSGRLEGIDENGNSYELEVD